MNSIRNILIIVAVVLLPFVGGGIAQLVGAAEGNTLAGSTCQCIDLESVSLGDRDGVDEAVSMPHDCMRGEVASTELQTVARHLRTVSFRMQWMAQNNKLFTRAFVRYLSKVVSAMTQCDTHVYTTAKVPCWKVPSDCYVFGIRHIII